MVSLERSIFAVFAAAICFFISHVNAVEFKDRVFKAGHSSLQDWLLPEKPPHPDNNKPNDARIELGKALFFDPRLSGDGNMSCATCHNPSLGWSDGLPTAKGFKSKVLGRATPTVINTSYNSIQMWDGRAASLEHQATGPMQSGDEMNTNMSSVFGWLADNKGYKALFAAAYPKEPINGDTVSRAIASFERQVVSRDSRFDRWVKGDKKALSAEEVRGFKLFSDPQKGNCAVCHSSPNFTDDGFHNLGLASFGVENPDVGRYSQRPLKLMKGAFKTPTLRDISLTAPYFHDGSAVNLSEVMDHYIKGGEVKSNISPNLKPLNLNKKEKQAIIAFMKALTSDHKPIELPLLPL